jgi:hypothetical protein
MTKAEKQKKQLEKAVLILNQHLNTAIITFQANVEKALSQVLDGRKLSYYEVFQNFSLSLSDLVDIALDIEPKCLVVRKNSRQRQYVVPRQMLCYFASQMGYNEEKIAKEIMRDRCTVGHSKKTVEDALTYNNIEYRKVYKEFIKRMKKYPNGDYLEHLD